MRFDPAEQLQLATLVGQAWELRETPYTDDAVDAIVDWHDRRHIQAFERRQVLERHQ